MNNYWLVFRLGWENDVDGFFLFDNEVDAEEMCLALAQEELYWKQLKDFIFIERKGLKSLYISKPTILDSCWFMVKCNYVERST